MIQENILKLVKYAKATGLIEKEDEVYTINRLLELFEVDDIEDATFDKINGEGDYTQEQAEEVLEDILYFKHYFLIFVKHLPSSSFQQFPSAWKA